METVFRVNTLRPTLRDRPQLSQRDDRLIESLVTVRLTNGPFHIPSKEHCIAFYSKEKKHLLPIFSPDLTVLVVLCPKVDFLRKIDTFYKGWHE